MVFILVMQKYLCIMNININVTFSPVLNIIDTLQFIHFVISLKHRLINTIKSTILILVMKSKNSISILVVFLFILLCDGDTRTLTFYEESNLAPQQIITYSDNTVVFRLVERLNATCNVPNLTYRILYLNGSSKLITVSDHDHKIPFINFCFEDATIKDIQVLDNIFLQNTITNYVLVTYTNDMGILCGMMIDWNGKIIK